MTHLPTAQVLHDRISAHGWQARLVPSARRFGLWNELAACHARGEFDSEFFDERIRPFEQAVREAPLWARSILIVAIPDTMIQLSFRWRGQEIPLTVPPTFIQWDAFGERHVERILCSDGSAEFRMAAASLPKKLLAARSGLARYGRNNITYVEGMGSYYRLCCLYTDILCIDAPWNEPEVLASCDKCGACVRACPAGAIDPDRFMVRAERCITYWQEKPADTRIPDDVDLSWGDQFIGCMKCQTVCPQNRAMLAIEEIGPPFTEQETASLLRGVAARDLSAETLAKLERNDILEYLDVLPRNLSGVFERVAGR